MRRPGKLEYRTDRGANVHIPIGKRSFDERQLVENYAALVEEMTRAKPAAAKGRYIKKITVTSTIEPEYHVDPSVTRGIAPELEQQARRRGCRDGLALVNTPAPETAAARAAEDRPRRYGSLVLQRIRPAVRWADSAKEGNPQRRQGTRGHQADTERLRATDALIVADYRS